VEFSWRAPKQCQSYCNFHASERAIMGATPGTLKKDPLLGLPLLTRSPLTWSPPDGLQRFRDIRSVHGRRPCAQPRWLEAAAA
jgi:hypothetical protein